MTLLKYPLALLCSFAVCLQAAAAQCSYAALMIDPLSAARADVYVGRGKHVEVFFTNEAATQAVETFPESTLEIRHIEAGTVCEIDGGIWVRDAVYLSLNEEVLIAKQFSGSSESLSFYDTRTCALKGQVDISDRAWSIESEGLLAGEQCANSQLRTCKRTVVHRWDRDCQAGSSEESIAPPPGAVPMGRR